MFLLIIILSYLLGCASTIALLLYLYTRYALYSPVVINEPQEEQYQTFHPLPENERAKNTAVDAVNYLLQFLFQELKDSSRLRRYIMHKLNTEFKELKNSRTGKIFLQNIVIQNFSIGKECPTFSDIQLERQERDERQLIKEFTAILHADYKDGFSVTLDVTLLFGHKCQLSIKVKHISGQLRLEFRREPFCHWLLVFKDEPFIDFDVKSYFATVESPQLAHIITQQLRRAIKRKQTWPSYKIRYQPFFPTSKQSLPTEILTANGNNIIPGTFDILIKYCDRLSIPLAIFDKQKVSFVSVFLTININEQMSADYLHINREQWPMKEIELIRNVNKIVVKEVNYMDRIELLIEELEPLPNGIEDIITFKAALEDKNVFLLRMQGQDVKTLKQTNRLLKQKIPIVITDGTASTTATTGYDDKIKIVVGMPLLHSVRVQRAVDSLNVTETEKQGGHSPALSSRSDESPSTPAPVRQRAVPSAVKFDKTVDSVALTSKQVDDEDEQSPNTTTTDTATKPQDTNIAKKPKQSRYSANDITLIMMNTDLLKQFRAQPTPLQKAEPYIEFNNRFEFEVGPNDRYLNVCLWCKSPLDCDVPHAGKKLILLGYATVALSEIVLDAHMSYKRETQMTLNFRSAYSPKANLNATLTESESKKRLELSTHKGYDDNLTHGFVTINIKHRPEIETKLNPQEKREQFIINGPILNDISTKLKEDERKEDQLKYINTINEQQELPTRKPTDHLFEDKTFTVGTLCACCHRKIWMKNGRQCRDCLVTIHKKCEEKFNNEVICTHEPIQLKLNPISTLPDDDLKNIVHIEMPDNLPIVPTTDDIDTNSIKSNDLSVSIPNNNRAAITTTTTTANRLSTKAAAAFSVLDSTARRSFRAFGNKNPNQPTINLIPSLASTSELSKSDESLHNPPIISIKKPVIINSPIQTSSKIANAASSAYSRLRDFKTKRAPVTSETIPIRKSRLSSDTTPNENILETDLRDIITKCLSDENNDFSELEHLLHERAVDDTALYAKANEVGPELFPDLTLDKRKQKLDGEISRLQHEIDLQCEIRDELTHECDQIVAEDNEKRKLRAKIANIDEKVQALGALTILYCSGLKHCRAQMGTKISKIIDEDDNQDYDDPQNDIDDEQS